MSVNGIDASMRDDFVRHAVNFDHDENLYLKKAEIEAAAEAWVASDDQDTPAEEAEEPVEEEAEASVEEEAEAPAEEAEAPVEEVSEESGQACPICNATNSADATTCESCGFAF
jgi:ribosomal protein L40E